MKTIKRSILLFSLISLSLVSCKKEDDENEIKIDFKEDAGYTHADATIAGGTTIKVGVEAETEKKKDPLIKINLTETIDNTTTGISQTDDINEEQDFEKDYSITLDTTSGSVHEYTFTVTNKDGLQEQKSLKITIQ